MRKHRSSTIGWGWPSVSPTTASAHTQTIRQIKRRAREKEIAVVLLIVLGVIEILRRAPGWLLLLTGILAAYVVQFIALHIWWIVVLLTSLAAMKLMRGVVEGWRSWDDIPY